MNRIKWFLLKILIGKGGRDMMALLIAQRVILERMTFEEVPTLLKEPVKEVLEECGMGYLADPEWIAYMKSQKGEE